MSNTDCPQLKARTNGEPYSDGSVMHPHVQPVSGRLFGGFGVNTFSAAEPPYIMTVYSLTLPPPVTVVLGRSEEVAVNPGRIINSVEPAINLSAGAASVTPYRELSTDSYVKPAMQPESIDRQVALNPSVPEFIPEQYKPVQSMEADNDNSHNSQEQIISKMNEIALCLIEYWQRDLDKHEMRLVMSFPDVWSNCIRLLEEEDMSLADAGSSNKKNKVTKVTDAAKSVLGTPGSEKKKGSIRSKFSEHSLRSNGGRFRCSLGLSISAIVEKLKKLQA